MALDGATLPPALAKVEKMANDRYGTDRGNPDRAAYIARTTQAVKAKIQDEVMQLNTVQRQAQGQAQGTAQRFGQRLAQPVAPRHWGR